MSSVVLVTLAVFLPTIDPGTDWWKSGKKNGLEMNVYREKLFLTGAQAMMAHQYPASLKQTGGRIVGLPAAFSFFNPGALAFPVTCCRVRSD